MLGPARLFTLVTIIAPESPAVYEQRALSTLALRIGECGSSGVERGYGAVGRSHAGGTPELK
jgi:hypothetical protein